MKDYKYLVLTIIVLLFGVFVTIGFYFYKETLLNQWKKPQPEIAEMPKQVKVNYEKAALDKLLELSRNQPELSPKDKLALNKLLDPLKGKTGKVRTTQYYNMIYDFELKEFEVEIYTPDYNLARIDAVEWLKSMGISQEGICILPVLFRMDPSAREKLNENIEYEFNPLPDGC